MSAFPAVEENLTNVPITSYATDISYCPSIRPEQFYLRRYAAYEQGVGHIMGPDLDPEGWSPVDSVTIYGHIFGNRQAKVSCTVCVPALHLSIKHT